MSIGTDAGEVLIPTVSDDGRLLSDDEAIALYRKTGRHLGIFDTPKHATAYAEQLHNDQAQQYGAGGYLSTDPNAGEAEPPLTRERPAPRHPHAQFPGMVADFVTGAAKELAAQGIRGGQVLRKIPGVGLLDHLMTPIEVNTEPSNPTQQVGGAALNAAEVMAPTGVLTSMGLKVLPRVAAQGAIGAGTAALQGKNPIAGAAASMAPTAALGVAHSAGPAIARNAPAIGRTIQGLSTGGFGGAVMAGNVPAMLATGATAVASNPSVIRGAGNLATKVGNSQATEAALRAALLQALGEDPASTDR
jgi:hypothetical protein